MKKLISALMMSAVVLPLTACKTTAKRDLANTSGADPYVIPDYNYKLTDIKTAGITPEQLFQELDPNRVIKRGASICSNRALSWSWNMKRNRNIDSGKVFVFYTKDFFTDPASPHVQAVGPHGGNPDEKVWWYHVAPYVVSDGKEIVLDGGFNPGSKSRTPDGELTAHWDGNITRPVTVNEWMLRFAKTTDCRELTGKDLIGAPAVDRFGRPMFQDSRFASAMRSAAALPVVDGKRCYYMKAPGAYWTPLSLVWHHTKRYNATDAVNPPLIRETFYESDVLNACKEAVSEDGFKLFGKGESIKACVSYLGLTQPHSSQILTSLETTAPTSKADKDLLKRKERALRTLR